MHDVRTEVPKSCEFTEKEYTTILGPSKARGLSLLPNAEGTADLVFALKAYLLTP
jgi:hypothetical protein